MLKFLLNLKNVKKFLEQWIILTLSISKELLMHKRLLSVGQILSLSENKVVPNSPNLVMSISFFEVDN